MIYCVELIKHAKLSSLFGSDFALVTKLHFLLGNNALLGMILDSVLHVGGEQSCVRYFYGRSQYCCGGYTISAENSVIAIKVSTLV